MIRSLCIAIACSMASGIAVAQEQGADDTAQSDLPDPPIIVIANPDEKPRVVSVGSRLPRSAPFANSGKATNVGTPGLVPQSGMSPHASVRKIKRKDCVSDDQRLRKTVICALATGDDLLDEGDLSGAIEMYRHVAYSPGYSAHERHAGSEKLYAAANDAGEPALREEGLVALLANGGMNPAQERAARRTLVALALAQNDDAKAMMRLRDVLEHDADDTRSRANLALVEHRSGLEDSARETMRRAIEDHAAKGLAVPGAWKKFVASE